MSIFGLLGDIISLPLDAVSDVSRAVQGKQVGRVKERLQDSIEELEDTLNL